MGDKGARVIFSADLGKLIEGIKRWEERTRGHKPVLHSAALLLDSSQGKTHWPFPKWQTAVLHTTCWDGLLLELVLLFYRENVC